MRPMRWGSMLAVAVAIAMVAGCATLGAPRPTPETPANDPAVVAIQSSADVGAIGCALIVAEGGAEDVRKATLAVAAAQEVLLSPVPSFAALNAALSEGLPPRYSVISTVVLQRIRVRLGQADVIPADSTGFAMANEFLNACRMALGGSA